jgi:hypothetical protein
MSRLYFKRKRLNESSDEDEPKNETDLKTPTNKIMQSLTSIHSIHEDEESSMPRHITSRQESTGKSDTYDSHGFKPISKATKNTNFQSSFKFQENIVIDENQPPQNLHYNNTQPLFGQKNKSEVNEICSFGLKIMKQQTLDEEVCDEMSAEDLDEGHA